MKEASNKIKVQANDIKAKKKRKIIILVIVLGILLVIVGGAATWYYFNYLSKEARERTAFELDINLIWHEVITESNGIKSILDNPTKESDLVKLNANATTLENSMKRKITRLEKIKAPPGYSKSKSKLKKGLEDYTVYLSYLQKDVLYKGISSIKVPEDIDEAQGYADKTRDSFADFVDTFKFTKKRIGTEVFDLTKLSDFIDNWQNQAVKEAKKRADEAAAAEAAQQAAYEAALKQAAEKTAQDFINSLTGVYQLPANQLWVGAQKIFDRYWTTASFNNFSSDYKKYFDDIQGRPTYIGGRVIQSEKVDSLKFNILVEEGERLDTVPDRPETKFLSYFIVERVGAGWFITSHGKR